LIHGVGFLGFGVIHAIFILQDRKVRFINFRVLYRRMRSILTPEERALVGRYANGETLADNARIKALAAKKAVDAHYPERNDIIVVADDSGLFVDCLGGRPGVRSARYRGAETPGTEDKVHNDAGPVTSAEQIGLLLAEIRSPGAARGTAGGADETRTASFRCVIAIIYPNGSESLTEGECGGEITQKPTGCNGFGYDPVFYLPDIGRTMAELTLYEKNSISHRGKAVGRMLDDIEAYLVKRERNK